MGILRWLLGNAIDRQAYRRAFEAGKQAAEAEHSRILKAANAEADARIEVAQRQAERLLSAAKADGLAIGSREGHKKGYQVGKEKGTTEGLLIGYEQAAADLGITLTKPVEEAAVHDFDEIYWGPHPNIYARHDRYTLRLIIDGKRYVQDFTYSVKHTRVRQDYAYVDKYDVNKAEAKLALIKAVITRDNLVPEYTRDSVLLADIVAETTPDTDGAALDLLRICQIFRHRTVGSNPDLDASSVIPITAFLGEDPEDRFELADKTLMTRPWTDLFEGSTPPQRFVDAFYELGLGGKNRTPRTVRDLLLITPKELRDCNGIGPVSLATFEKALGDNGLALWGSDYQPPPPQLDVGERHFRAIHLE